MNDAFPPSQLGMNPGSSGRASSVRVGLESTAITGVTIGDDLQLRAPCGLPSRQTRVLRPTRFEPAPTMLSLPYAQSLLQTLAGKAVGLALSCGIVALDDLIRGSGYGQTGEVVHWTGAENELDDLVWLAMPPGQPTVYDLRPGPSRVRLDFVGIVTDPDHLTSEDLQFLLLG